MCVMIKLHSISYQWNHLDFILLSGSLFINNLPYHMYNTHYMRPASWEICMQVSKQQLELDMKQQTGST